MTCHGRLSFLPRVLVPIITTCDAWVNERPNWREIEVTHLVVVARVCGNVP
jgi:hypothetical protein